MELADNLGMSRTLQFGKTIRQLKADGVEVISLGLGEPEYDTPAHIKQAATQALAEGLTRYGDASGLAALRDVTAEKLRRDNGIAADPGELLITPGCKNAMFLACAALLEPGQEAVTFAPGYVSNIPILQMAEPGARVHEIDLEPDSFTLPYDAIRAAVNQQTRLLLINYPNNPTGRMLSSEEASFLVELMSEYPRLWLVSDEIYEALPLTDAPRISAASFDGIADRVVTVGGYSKSYSMTGWRIGYLHARGEILRRARLIHQQLNTNTATFIQRAALAALTGPQDDLETFRSNLRERRRLYEDLVTGHPGLSGLVPQGGIFGFLNIGSTGLSSDDFSAELLKHQQVAVLPGIAFGGNFDQYVRVSLVNETEQIAEGLRRIGEFVGTRGETT